MVRCSAAPRLLANTGCVMIVAACASAPVQQSAAPANPVVFGYELSTHPESALATARFALGTLDGAIQMPQVRPKFTTISTHYMRPRRGGGQRQVAIIIAVDRAQTKRDSALVTLLEIRGFAVDMAEQAPTGLRRTGLPRTALSTNAPALRTPRPVTPADTVDWRSLLLVMESLEASGARRLP